MEFPEGICYTEKEAGDCRTPSRKGEGGGRDRRIRIAAGKRNVMIAKREVRSYTGMIHIWCGKFRNSHNLPHWHEDCELLWVEQGSVDIFCGKQPRRLEKGDGFLIGGGQVHCMHAKTPDTVLLVFFYDGALMAPYLAGRTLSDPLFSADYGVPETYSAVFSLLCGDGALRSGFAACELLSLVLRIHAGEGTEPVKGTRKTDDSLKRLLTEMDAHPDAATFSEAAARMNMSEAYFSRFFHEATGLAFSDYLNYLRTEKAVSLLQEKKMSVTEVSVACGFGTIRSFNRVFKALTGYTPSGLPEGYILDGNPAGVSEDVFDPTRRDCELLESSGG